jgi:hypothetical protein
MQCVGKNEFFDVKSGGKYSYHCNLQIVRICNWDVTRILFMHRTVNLPAAFRAVLLAYARKNANYRDIHFAYLLTHAECALQLISKMVLAARLDTSKALQSTSVNWLTSLGVRLYRLYACCMNLVSTEMIVSVWTRSKALRFTGPVCRLLRGAYEFCR